MIMLSATIGVLASLSDTATGLQANGQGSAVLNLAQALGIEDVTLAANSMVQLPMPIGVTNAQFVFVNAFGVPDLQIVDAGSTAGTSTSGSSAGTSVGATDTLTLNIDGDGARTITLAANTTGAAIAADIQAKVRALAPVSAVNAVGYLGFAAAFASGQYVLTSGLMGTGSTVVVTGGTAAAGLKLGTGNGGSEVSGSGASLQVPQGAAQVLYNKKGAVWVATAVGGLMQFAIGG